MEASENPAGEVPKAVATTLQRTETLFADGYNIDPTARANVFAVTTPERLDRQTGELRKITYSVDLAGGTCTCEQWARYRVCKHEKAARRAVETARAALQEARRLLTLA